MVDRTKTVPAFEMRATMAAINARLKNLEESIGLPAARPARPQTMASIDARLTAIEEAAHGQSNAR